MKDYFKYFFVITIVVLGLLSYFVIEPFIVAILSGLTLAYVLHPIFQRLNKRIKSEAITAFLMSLVVIILLSVPTVFLIKETADEARFFYISTKAKLFNGDMFEAACPDADGGACHLVNQVREFLAEPQVRSYLETTIAKFSDFILDEASAMIFSLPRIFLGLFVAFFVCFYATLEGKKWVERAKGLLPIKKKYQKEIFVKIDHITHAVIYSSVLVALIQGALGGIGFYIFGVNSPILFGILMSVLALIPFLGTAIIWAPAGGLLVLDGYLQAESSLMLRGVLLLAYGLLIVSSIDNILKPRLIGEAARVHPVVILVGVLGGISLLGFIGFVIGPLILSMFMAFLDIYEREKRVIVK